MRSCKHQQKSFRPSRPIASRYRSKQYWGQQSNGRTVCNHAKLNVQAGYGRSECRAKEDRREKQTGRGYTALSVPHIGYDATGIVQWGAREEPR